MRKFDPSDDRKFSKSRSKNEYDLADDSKYSKSKSKKRHKTKKRQKRTKHDLSDSSSSNSDLSNESDYKRKRHNKKKISWKKDPIKLCVNLTANFPTTAYKPKIIKFKSDEDPLQRRIYFLTFIESIEMIFYQYKETSEILPDNPKNRRGGYYRVFKKAIGNLLHANIDVHSRRLISEFPGDGVKCISKLQSHCANMAFSEKVGIIEVSSKLHIK